ncbi:hypothetical protein SSU98_0339 [Streptococcus suis 98HAH33]|nr:hypothetical protein SSU98_0339 [Streptococcus suis 98HAH33]
MLDNWSICVGANAQNILSGHAAVSKAGGKAVH